MLDRKSFDTLEIIGLAKKRNTLVLDEADEMLKMGFIEDIDFIMSCLIHEHQTLFFAATMPEEIDRLIRTYLKEPVIDSVWHGSIPNLRAISKYNGKRNGKKYFKKRSRPVSPKSNGIR